MIILPQQFPNNLNGSLASVRCRSAGYHLFYPGNGKMHEKKWGVRTGDQQG